MHALRQREAQNFSPRLILKIMIIDARDVHHNPENECT